MSRLDKQFKLLAILEKEFLSELNDATVDAAEGRNSNFFLSAEFNPWSQLNGRTDSVTDVLVDKAHQIIDLRRETDSPEHFLAKTFLTYCQKFVDVSDHNRPGVKKHALSMLEEIYVETRNRVEDFEKRATDGT